MTQHISQGNPSSDAAYDEAALAITVALINKNKFPPRADIPNLADSVADLYRLIRAHLHDTDDPRP